MSDLPTTGSYHYPLLTTPELQVQYNIRHNNNATTVPKYPRPNWSDNQAGTSYSRYLIDCAKSLPTINFDGVISHYEAHNVFDFMCGDVVAVMHEACSKVISDKHCTYRGRFKSNNSWNKDCLNE